MTGLDSDGLRLDERGEAWTSLRRHAALGLGGKVLEVATLVALVTLLPRAFGAADFGAFALALSVVMLASTSVALGGPTLASRFLADVSPEQRPALARGIAERSATWRLGAVGVAGLVVLVVLVVRPDLVPVTAAVFVLVAVALDAAATLVLQVGLALGAARAWAARYPLQNTVLVVAALVGYAAFGRTGALAALPLASGAALVLALVSTLPHLRGVQAARALPHGLGRFAVVQSLSGLGVQVVHRGGAIAVAILGGTDAEVGFAALAAGIATAATYVVWQVYSLELPRVARQEAGAAFRATAHLTRIAIVVAAPVALVAVLLCPTVVPAVLGNEYEDAVPAIALALAILPLAPGTAALNQVAALRMVPEVRLAAVTIGLAAFVVTVALAVPAHGAVGAAAALVLGSAVALAVAAVPRRPLVDRPLVAVSLAAAAAVVALAVAW